MMGMPQLYWEGLDDRGNRYAGDPGGGGGGGEEYRMECGFTPAVDEAATALTLTCPDLQWMAFGPGTRSRVQPGPWQFDIPLT
jgi:hypothetical protein